MVGKTLSIEQCYAFILNVRSLLDGPAFQLAEGHEPRRANSDEIEGIKRTIERLKTGMFSDYRLWEDRLEQLAPSSLRISVDRSRLLDASSLPKEEWRYHVIAFRGDNGTLNELSPAFDLSHVELEVGFTIAHLDLGSGSQQGITWTGARLFHVLEAAV